MTEIPKYQAATIHVLDNFEFRISDFKNGDVFEIDWRE